MMSANAKAAAAVQASLDSVTADPKSGIPGVVFVSVNRNGDIIQANTSGTEGADAGRKPMSLDTVFWIASCTKLLTAIGCMQAVEQGKLSLDDPQSLYKLCPEIEKAEILNDDGKTLRPRQKDITLRMLLSHTAGYGYEFFNPGLLNYRRPIGWDVFSGDAEEFLRMPLVNEPGSRWEYGINIDWAGIALERASGLKLNDYIQQNIMKPLALDSINMFPSKEMKANLASMHQRKTDGQIEERDHVYRRPLAAETPEEQARLFHSGGAGCFAKPIQYVQVLATLLNDGTSPKTGAQILKPETVKAMFENQIPEFPDFGRQGFPAPKPDHTNPVSDAYPQEGNPPQGWGISFFQTIEPGATGRGRNTAWWTGIANQFWWCDREKGVAGMIATQILPFGDMKVLGQWINCEKAVYDNLKPKALGKL